MQPEITIIEIDWTEAIGPVMRVGSPYLFGWLRAVYVQPRVIADGRVVVLARKNESAEWVECQGPVTQSDAETLVRAFADLGIPERAPLVETVPDSSDTLSTSSVRVVVGEKVQVFTVQTQCSGFTGRDADGLRAIFQQILDLSGYGHQHSIFGGSCESNR